MPRTPEIDFDPKTRTLSFTASAAVTLDDSRGSVRGVGYCRPSHGGSLADKLRTHLSLLGGDQDRRTLVDEGDDGDQARAALLATYQRLVREWSTSISAIDMELRDIKNPLEPHPRGEIRIWSITPDNLDRLSLQSLSIKDTCGRDTQADLPGHSAAGQEGSAYAFGRKRSSLSPVLGRHTYETRHSKRKIPDTSRPTFTLTLNRLVDYEKIHQEVIFPVPCRISISKELGTIEGLFPHLLAIGSRSATSNSAACNFSTCETHKVTPQLADHMAHIAVHSLIQNGIDLSETKVIEGELVDLIQERISRELLRKDMIRDSDAWKAIHNKVGDIHVTGTTYGTSAARQNACYHKAWTRNDFREPAELYWLDTSIPQTLSTCSHGYRFVTSRKLISLLRDRKHSYATDEIMAEAFASAVEHIRPDPLFQPFLSQSVQSINELLVSSMSRYISTFIES